MNANDSMKAVVGPSPAETVSLYVDQMRLTGQLSIPDRACGLVVLAQSEPGAAAKPRSAFLARSIRFAGFATLNCDLVGTPSQEGGRDVGGSPERLAERLEGWLEMARHRGSLKALPVGLVGNGVVGSAAMLIAARSALPPRAIAAIAGRVELVSSILSRVQSATLLVVGELDRPVARFNRTALRVLRCHRRLELIPGAHHDFHEPGTVARVAVTIRRWMRRYLISPAEAAAPGLEPELRVIAPDGPLDETVLSRAALECAPVAHALRNR